MATHATFAQRLLIAGGFAVAISVAPLVSAFGGSHAATPLAECPVGQELNPLTATCHPSGNAENPIVRRNRLNLLSRIRQICLSVADLGRLEG